MSVTLASGDVPVATATVTKSLLSGQQPGSADIATMTFYSKANDPNLLYATNVVSGHNEIKPSSWVQGFVWYWWNNQTGSTNLVWNTVSTGGIPIPINAPGSSTSNPMTSSAPATNPASPTAATTTQSSVTSGSATETSSQSSIPAKSSSSGGGLSTGAIAGVAIGCAIAGALIAALLVWFCMKRKRSAGTRDSEASAIALMNRHEKGPAATAKTLSLSSASPVPFAFESGLSQPLEDKAITGEISKISNLIKNHVQSYYHTKSVSPGMIDYDDLQALGSNLPVSIGTLSTLLGNAATREIALRFCIAWIVTSRIGLYDSPNTTFLPLELSECLQAISSVDQGSRGKAMYFAKWRAITAELTQSAYIRNPFSVNDSRVHNIKLAAGVLENILRPFADSRMDDAQRTRNLEEILKRSAQFAFTLFSQPSRWDFDWENEHGVKSGSICIFPALVQISDENGEPIRPPRPFSEAMVRRLDE